MVEISDLARDKLPLGKDVRQAIDDDFQDWQSAFEWALDHLPDPPAVIPWLDWGIGLCGNMLWACTVFFPPVFVAGEVVIAATREVQQVTYAAASAATKAVSVLGAQVGSSGAQIAGMLRDYGGRITQKEAKAFLHDWLAKNAAPARQEFVPRPSPNRTGTKRS